MLVLAACLPRPVDVRGEISITERIGFGAVMGQDSATHEILLENVGPGTTPPLGAAELTGADAARFTIVLDTCAGLEMVVGEFCTVYVMFTPATLEPAAAQLSIDAANDGPLVTQLNGGGVEPVAFAPRVTLTQLANGYAVGDVDGSGKLDLVTTADALLNMTPAGSEDPTFAASSLSLPMSPAALAIIGTTSINRDAQPDLVTIGPGNQVSVLVNSTPTGAAVASFESAVPFATATGPDAVEIADLDGNSLPDVVVRCMISNTITILFNQTAPQATAASLPTRLDLQTSSVLTGFAIGDVTGDGKPDVVVGLSNGGPFAASVAVFENTTTPGAPAFTPIDVTASVEVGGSAIDVALADLDRDGRLDIAFIDGLRVKVMLNATPAGGALEFDTSVVVLDTTGAAAITPAELNGDGNPDLLVSTGNKLVVLYGATVMGSRTPAFAAVEYPMIGTQAGPITIGDLAGDAQPDVLVRTLEGGALLIHR
ncbi:MAG: repeat protein [Deltaproteobacteria bacterium]|nr:repeat protein [Deltaproteobacteria bacterium]